MVNMKYRTLLPEHAAAEIKKDPKQRQFWDAWAATGDAKLDARDAARDLIAVESEAIDCRTAALTALKPLVNGCGCGKHGALIAKARAELEHKRTDVDKAIDKFKRGPG